MHAGAYYTLVAYLESLHIGMEAVIPREDIHFGN